MGEVIASLLLYFAFITAAMVINGADLLVASGVSVIFTVITLAVCWLLAQFI